MCRHCLHVVRPDRQRFVSESGHYLINYAGCLECTKKQHPEFVPHATEQATKSNGSGEDAADPISNAIMAAASRPISMIKAPMKVHQHSIDENSATEVEDGEYEEIITYQHTCAVCSHVIADHYYSFRVCKVKLNADGSIQEEEEKDGSESNESPETNDESRTKVTHDYLMECVLCGKGTDEQHHQHQPTTETTNASSSQLPISTTATAPSFSLSAIQVKSNADVSSKQTQDDEWTE